MKAIPAKVIVDSAGNMHVQTTERVAEGSYSAFVVVGDAEQVPSSHPEQKILRLPKLDLGVWRGQEFRREDMYDDDGR
jgi:hypothetical protein